MFTIKKILFYAVIGGALYYGWPIIEALYIILPIPDLGFAGTNIKNFFASGWGFISAIPLLGEFLNSLLTIVTGSGSGPNSSQAGPSFAASGYAQADGQGNLAQPDVFLEDDDSDEDIGKPSLLDDGTVDTSNDIKLNYDSDENKDDDLIDTMTNELADFGATSTTAPKLSGPK